MLRVQILSSQDNSPLSPELELPVLHGSLVSGPLLGKGLQLSQTIPNPSSDSTTNTTVPLRLYDPGYKNTTVCQSAISRIDPEGSLLYRGIPVQDLLSHSSYLEVSYLLIHGSLPSKVFLSFFSMSLKSCHSCQFQDSYSCDLSYVVFFCTGRVGQVGLPGHAPHVHPL